MKKTTLNFKQALRYAMVLMGCVALLSACKKEDQYDFDNSVPAYVNFVNASPDAGSAQLYVQDIVRTPSAISYGNASGYFKTYLGSQDVAVKAPNGTTTLISTTGQFDANANYTYFLVGQNSSLGLVAVTDDLIAPASGKAKIRFVNAAPNASAANLNLGSTTVVSNIAFRGVSPSVEVNAGSYILSVSSSPFLSSTLNTTLESGKVYTIYAKGLVGTTGNSAFSIGIFTNK
jgi:hypothetical protein